MDRIKIGNYIQLKRKENNLTQEQLAEKLGVSNKTVSKWECGKALPEYYLVEELCLLLGISLTEMFSGQDNNKFDEKQMIEMLKRIQRLENEKKIIWGCCFLF